ncbi:MAG: TetR/AcrR family transcriptional regulator [Pseudomonadota bacterium]
MKRSRGRPRGFDPYKALDAALETFWRQGYRNTSLDDLVAAMGASRASIYEMFGDKRALFIKCVDVYGERFSDRVAEVMETEPDGRKALCKLMTASAERLASSDAPAGCLRCNSTMELMGSDAALDAALAQANARYHAVIESLVRRSVAEGDLAPEEAETLPAFIVAAVNGMATSARAGADLPRLMHIVERTVASWPEPGR